MFPAPDHGMNPDPTDPPSPSTGSPPRLVDDLGTPPANSAPLLADADQDEESSPAASSENHDVSGPAWQGCVFAAVPLLICIFGAGRETWSRGLGALLIGLTLLLFRPWKSLPPILRLAFIAAVSAPLLSLLPASWFGALPAWRAKLVNDWGLALSDTVTPQFFSTLEAWLFFTLCAVWLSWCLSRGFSREQRRAILYSLAGGGVLLCLLTIAEALKLLHVPWWPRHEEWGPGFGPFANRNHISSVAAISSVLCAACAFDSYSRKSKAWALFVLGFLVAITCIFMNTSRAGILLLFVGMTAWLGTSAMGSGFFKKLTVSMSLALIIATLLVISSGGVSARLESTGLGSFVTSQGRTTIYLRTLAMTLDAPWLGQGLGNFAAVFPQFSGSYNLRERPIHPESDLLWLLSEGGLLTLLPCLFVVFWLWSASGPWFKRMRKSRSGKADQRLRNSAAIVFGMGAVHGIFDVPFHGLGYFSMLALLGGIAVRPRRLPSPATIGSTWSLRAAGLGALCLGAAWLAVSQGRLILHGKSAAEILRHQANELADSGSYADALVLFNKAVAQTPMDYRLYFERARVRLFLQQPVNDALADFSRARALEPNDTDMCYREGLVWLRFRPELAIIPWREIMLRWPAYYFSTLLNYAEEHPELKEPLWNLASSVELKLTYLGRVQTKADFDRCLRSILKDKPDLEGLKPAQRESLFIIWSQQGDRAALMTALENNKTWRDDGWRILAEHYASESDFQRACQTIVPYLPSILRTAPGASTDIPALERAMLYNPNDPKFGIELFQAQKIKGDIDGALHTLEKIALTPNAPAYVRQEIAALYITKQDYRRAWENLREAMKKR